MLRSFEPDKKYISLICGILFALSGGAMDMYTFLYRGGVFANAQTGNMIFLGATLAERDFEDAIKFLLPIICFALGIVISNYMKHRSAKAVRTHWRQIAIIVEIVILACVSFVPQTCNELANSLVSLACGIQVETFRSISENSIATTMCIGNLRNGTYFLSEYIHSDDKDRSYLRKAMLYYGINFMFVLGAVIEGFILMVGVQSMIFSCLLLAIAVILMQMYDPYGDKEIMMDD